MDNTSTWEVTVTGGRSRCSRGCQSGGLSDCHCSVVSDDQPHVSTSDIRVCNVSDNHSCEISTNRYRRKGQLEKNRGNCINDVTRHSGVSSETLHSQPEDTSSRCNYNHKSNTHKTNDTLRYGSNDVIGPKWLYIMLLLLTCLLCQTFGAFPSRKAHPDATIVAMWPTLGRRFIPYLNGGITKWKWKIKRTLPYILKSNSVTLLTSEPDVVLYAFCDTVLDDHANTVIIISNPGVLGKKVPGYMFQLADSLKLPVITWNSDNTARSLVPADSLVINLAPSIHHQIEAMMALLKYYDWPKFSVITSLQPGYRVFISALRKYSLTNPGWDGKNDKGIVKARRYELMSEVTLVHPKNKTYVGRELQKLKESDSRVFLFFASRLESLTIFEVATSLNITGSEYMWVVSQSVVLEKTIAARALPVGVLAIYFDGSRKLMANMIKIAVDIWVNAMQSMYKDLVARGVTDTTDRFVPNVLCENNRSINWTHGRTLFNYMLNVSGITGVTLDATGQQTEVNIKIKNLNNEKKWMEVGEWDREKGLTISDITWPGDSDRPPTGKPSKHYLKILTLAEPPYVNYEPVESDNTCGKRRGVECRIYIRMDKEEENATTNGTVMKCCTGLNMDLLLRLSDELDFDFELWEVEDGFWGGIDEHTGEMNGLVRALMDGKADMAVTSLKINPMRAEAVDFSVSYMETGIAIIVAIREGAISATAFLKPYDYPSWCLILLFSVHATGAAVFVFEWLSPRGLQRGKAVSADDPSSENAFSLCRAFWLMWAMLFQATVSVYNPRGMASRFLSNLWALFAVVFLAHYTANLAAFMITESEYYDLTGIQDRRFDLFLLLDMYTDLVGSSEWEGGCHGSKMWVVKTTLTDPYQTKPRFKFATVPYGNTANNLQMNNPTMYEYMKEFKRPNVTEGIRAVKKNSIDAFIYDATVLEYWAGKDEGCKVLTVGTWFAMTGYGVAFPIGSKWRAKVDDVLLRMIESGDMQRLQSFWLRGACTASSEEKPTSHSLGILNFTSAFILLACGMIIASLFLIIEFLFFKFGRKYLREIDKCGICGLISLSMGKSLTFEQSVMSAVMMHKTHRCKDPACETHMLRLQRELDLALFKVDKLTDKLTVRGVGADDGTIATWRDPDSSLRHRPGPSQSGSSTLRSYAASPSSKTRDNYYTNDYPSSDRANTLPKFSPERDYVNQDLPKFSSPNIVQTYTLPHEAHSDNHVPSANYDDYRKSESEGNLRQNSQPLRRSPSYTSAISTEDIPKSPTKVRYHDGNYYVEVDNKPEIETVL